MGYIKILKLQRLWSSILWHSVDLWAGTIHSHNYTCLLKQHWIIALQIHFFYFICRLWRWNNVLVTRPFCVHYFSDALWPGSLLHPLSLRLMTTTLVTTSLKKPIFESTQFNSEFGGSMFLRKIGIHQQKYTVSALNITVLIITSIKS